MRTPIPTEVLTQPLLQDIRDLAVAFASLRLALEHDDPDALASALDGVVLYASSARTKIHVVRHLND